MDAIEEYQKITLLVASFDSGTSQEDSFQRPVHIANYGTIQIGSLSRLFERLDDDVLSIKPIAQTVGARAPKRADSPDVLII